MQGELIHWADPFQSFSLRGLAFTREIWSDLNIPQRLSAKGQKLKQDNKNSSFPLPHFFSLHWTHHSWLNYVITATVEIRDWGKKTYLIFFLKNPNSIIASATCGPVLATRPWKKDINRKFNTVLAGWGNEKAKCTLVKERKIISQKMNKR